MNNECTVPCHMYPTASQKEAMAIRAPFQYEVCSSSRIRLLQLRIHSTLAIIVLGREYHSSTWHLLALNLILTHTWLQLSKTAYKNPDGTFDVVMSMRVWKIRKRYESLWMNLKICSSIRVSGSLDGYEKNQWINVSSKKFELLTYELQVKSLHTGTCKRVGR